MARTNPLKPASLALAGLFALIAVAPANALPALPVSLPAIDQHLDTPVGSIDAYADQNGAKACLDAYTPALPALPAVPQVPVPLPVSPPAIPDAQASATACASAGLDGAAVKAGADTMGARAQAAASAGMDGIAADAQADTPAASTEAHASLLDGFLSWLGSLF